MNQFLSPAQLAQTYYEFGFDFKFRFFSIIIFQRFLYKLKSKNCDFEIIFLSSLKIHMSCQQPILNSESNKFFMNFLLLFFEGLQFFFGKINSI